MNAFIPQNPRAVVKVNEYGNVVATSNNIGSEFRVDIVHSDAAFDHLTKGLPFDSRRPAAPEQVLAHGKH